MDSISLKRLISVLIISCMIGSPILGSTTIADIAKDPNKKAIKFTVDKGYLPLYQDQTFRSNQAINRQEIAFIIYKLNQQLSNANQTSTSSIAPQSSKIKELLAQLTHKIDENTKRLSRLNTEKQLLHHDITASNESLSLELAKTKDELNQQQNWLWIAIGTIGLLTLSK